MSIDSLLKDEVKVVTVTPDMAECWLRTSKYRNQRNIMKARVRRYADEMKRGDWGLSESAIVLGIRPSGDHLLNGQHRLTAVVDSNTTQRFVVHRRVFASEHDMDIAYALMDRGATRTGAHQLHALEIASSIGVPEEVLRAADVALRFIADNFGTDRSNAPASRELYSPQSKERMLREWQIQIFAYHKTVNQTNKRIQKWFYRRPVMAVALATFRWQPEKASEFWTPVCRGSGLVDGSAEHHLYTFLASETVQARHESSYARKVANAWNAWFEDRSITRLHAYGGSGFVQIDGTPWRDSRQCVKPLVVMGLKSE